jgi:hypothetical protein
MVVGSLLLQKLGDYTDTLNNKQENNEAKENSPPNTREKV